MKQHSAACTGETIIKTIPTLILILATAICSSCDIRDVLGPRDKPDFQNKDWTAVTIAYGVNTRDSNGHKRTTIVTDPAIINNLKAKMTVRRIQGLSTGTRNQLRFKERNGHSWHGNIVSETRIDLSSTEDGWRSYCIEFSDGAFVEALLDICVRNERISHPKAKPENIVLVEQFLVEPWPDAPPESARLRKRLLEAYPPIQE